MVWVRVLTEGICKTGTTRYKGGNEGDGSHLMEDESPHFNTLSRLDVDSNELVVCASCMGRSGCSVLVFPALEEDR
jgi:hypothetical protein